MAGPYGAAANLRTHKHCASAIFAFVDDLVGHDEARYRGVEECRMPWVRVLLSAERTLEGIGRGRGFTRLTFRGPGYIRGQRHA